MQIDLNIKPVIPTKKNNKTSFNSLKKVGNKIKTKIKSIKFKLPRVNIVKIKEKLLNNLISWVKSGDFLLDLTAIGLYALFFVGMSFICTN